MCEGEREREEVTSPASVLGSHLRLEPVVKEAAYALRISEVQRTIKR